MRTMLFVCTANICRSPMAEAIFNALAEDAGSSYRARSAGLAAPEGASAASRAAQTLAEIGVSMDPRHAARQVNEVVVEGADVVLAMTPRQAVELRRLFGGHASKIYALAEYVGGGPDAGIADPYGHAQAAFRSCARQLLGYLEPLVSLVGDGEQTRPEESVVVGNADRTRGSSRTSHSWGERA